MIGRFAVYNPGIFDFLKGVAIPPFPHLKAEYIELAEEYGTPQRYRDNVLERLGREYALHLKSSQLVHVQG